MENTGWRGHDYAFDVRTGHGEIFDISNSDHMHLGTNLNFEIPDGEVYRLYAEDGLRTEHVRVDVSAENGWADFVFDDDYQLMTLREAEAYIEKNKLLPEIPSTEDVGTDGIDLAEMDKILLQKVEELTFKSSKWTKKIRN